MAMFRIEKFRFSSWIPIYFFLLAFTVSLLPGDVYCFNPCSARKMWDAYNAMRRANCRNCDRYFHCIGNYNAVHHCSGIWQSWTARSISNMREWMDGFTDSGSNSDEDQEANADGRSGYNCAALYLGRVNCAYKPYNGGCYWD